MYYTTINGKKRRFNAISTCVRMARNHGPEGIKVIYSQITGRFYSV